MTKLLCSRQLGLRVFGWLAAFFLAAGVLVAQTPAPRIQAEISSAAVSTLRGSLHPLAQDRFDSGRMPSGARLNGMSIVFSRSAAQQADLEALIAAQQDPASPLYHQWLSPEQFAARFGMAQSDIAKVENWLEQQGFSIDSVARSQNMIRFSGTAGQVEQAFQTQMHYYTVNGEKHFAPSTELTIPSAFAPVVTAVRNLNDFRPRPMIQRSRVLQANPAYTSSVSGNVFFAPGDIQLAYGVKALIGAGTTGVGQSIVAVGQSSIVNSDIENFETAAGLTVKDPTQVLVPGSGTPQAFAGDQGESDLDIEWSGAMAPGAEIFFVYTGSNTNYGIYDSIQYAVDGKIGNIISVSYGSCEPELSAATATALDAVFQQAAAQGQTVVAASGDAGSSACYVSPTTTNPTLAAQEALAVSYPASSQYVTGVGGTEITSANDVAGNQYWEAKGSSDEITSLLAYIPEVAWNDDATAIGAGATTLSATGGGVSTLYTTKPSWQTGVPGIPSDGKRDVPDVSFYASPDLPGFLFCTSDTSDWNSGQTASCSSGFRDASTQDLTVAGGTSFSTPIFAGMVAILNQDKGYVSGQGLLNPTLYSLAATPATYAAVFNDITTGNNECPTTLGSSLESSYCSTASEGSYTAGTGYDLVTGLGSVNLSALATAWPASTSTTLVGTTTTVAATTTTPASGANDTITITVASNTGTTTPTGNISLSIDGGGTSYSSSGSVVPLTLGSGGTATYTANFTTAGVHTLVAQYAGDSTHAASTGTVAITIAGTSSGKGTFAFAFSPSTLTISQGSAGTENLTITPSGGYTGTIDFNVAYSNNSALANLCVYASTGFNSNGSASITGTAPLSAQIGIDANGANCAATGASRPGAIHRIGTAKTSKNNPPSPAPLAITLAGLFLAGCIGRSSRKLRGLAAIVGLLSLGLGLSACGGGSSSSSSVSNPPKGTYTITLTGQDSATATITTSQSFTLTID